VAIPVTLRWRSRRGHRHRLSYLVRGAESAPVTMVTILPRTYGARAVYGAYHPTAGVPGAIDDPRSRLLSW